MDFVKNKYGIAFLLIVAIAAIHYFFFYERCEQPDEMVVALTQLQCVNAIDPAALRENACLTLKGTQECVFEESDRPDLQKFLNKVVNDCTDSILKTQGMCIDKYEKLK